MITLGTFTVGLVALGCVAFAQDAYAWLSAVGWETAQSGGFSIARLAAVGPVAFAQHANDPAAHQILMDPHAERNQMIFFIVIALASLLPVSFYARELRRRLGKKPETSEARPHK